MSSREAAPARSRVTIVGAGIVGISCACCLQREGFEVTVIDRLGPGEAASFGNAGGLAVGEIVPMAVPGLIFKVPGWLLDPLGPLALRWSYLPKLIPWLVRFLAAGSRSRLQQNVAASAALCGLSLRDFKRLVAEACLQRVIRGQGALFLYDSAAELAADQYKWDLRREHGVAFEELSGDAIGAVEPEISPHFTSAVMMEDWYHIGDPFRLVTGLADHFSRRGGRIERAEVRSIEVRDGDAHSLRFGNGLSVEVERLVIAAGAWSHELSSQLGDRVPLETERGYHMTLPEPGVRPARMVIYVPQGFVITPMEMGLRVAGTVELAGLEAPPDYERARVLARKAKRVFPALDDRGGTPWMGHRPVLPDCLPVIGRSAQVSNVYYAFGHGHLGLTWGPTTGELITAALCGRQPEIDLAPYRVDRF